MEKIYDDEIWVTCKGNLEVFAPTAAGFLAAFEMADELIDGADEDGVEVLFHRWDRSISAERGPERGLIYDEATAYVYWDDDGLPEELEADLTDPAGNALRATPKKYLTAFTEAREAFIRKMEAED